MGRGDLHGSLGPSGSSTRVLECRHRRERAFGGESTSRWLLLLAVCGSLCALPGSSVLADIPRDGAGTFKSEKGGYQLWIPAGWHVKEEVSDRSYRAVLSREEVSDV